jgi:hypothetical protein
MPDLARAERLLRELMAEVGVQLPPGCKVLLVTAAQAALLEFGSRHQFSEVKVEFRGAQPYMATVEFAGMVEHFLLEGG